mmetsp:Transcript_55327/g.129486  ORF Transcript_55327/g.129486 Transcript_55327/m.129486 type:complete len:328 (+) Transcript_55327:433-1416(+)
MLASHALPSRRALLVRNDDPNPDPLTVTDTLPVLGRFVVDMDDRLAEPYVSICVPEPTDIPAVIDTLRLPATDPTSTNPDMEVSDCHTLASQLENPRRIRADDPCVPSPAPSTVTEKLPVAARLVGNTLDALGTSYDPPAVRLPRLIPTVIPIANVPPGPPPTRHLNDVEDTHPLASALLAPNLAAPLTSACASPAPLIVTIVALVHDATFPTATDEIVPASYDPTSVTDPVPDPTVTPSLKVPIVVPAVKHVNELSDAHSLASHDVAPAWPTPVAPCWPIPAPTNVTMMEPVAGVFDRMTCDTLAASNDAASVTEPTNMAVVMVKV